MKLMPICRHRKNPETAISPDVVSIHYLDEYAVVLFLSQLINLDSFLFEKMTRSTKYSDS